MDERYDAVAGGRPLVRKKRVDEATTLITEPHVIALMRCNIWHVKGRDRDLIVDTGMGLASVAGELAD